jgi:hypothetical protein
MGLFPCPPQPIHLRKQLPKATSRSRRAGTGYPTPWNAFKRIAASASPNEKRDLFAGTARQIYRLGDA